MTGVKIGEAAPDFDLVSDQGTRVRLSSLRGRKGEGSILGGFGLGDSSD